MDKIIVKRSKDADTRSAGNNVTKDSLLANSLSHISDVKRVGFLISQMLINQCQKHDYTKIQGIDQFYEDFTSGKQGADFKALPWFQSHLEERHHLNDRVPEDVNLIDVLEMVIDCTVAGMARSGDVYPIEIKKEVLDKAIENTKNLIIDSIEVIDND